MHLVELKKNTTEFADKRGQRDLSGNVHHTPDLFTRIDDWSSRRFFLYLQYYFHSSDSHHRSSEVATEQWQQDENTMQTLLGRITINIIMVYHHRRAIRKTERETYYYRHFRLSSPILQYCARKTVRLADKPTA